MIYLIVMDFLFTFIDVLVAFFILLLTVFRVDDEFITKVDNCAESLFSFAFGGLSKIDIIGFRRLKTSSQLTFESMP